ncbi:hypothetical protein SAMN04489740_1088 [Arthrobacter alpinus]|uniref:Uncharacterized protein n=1 Tax=Arthrobacter alpinus TaxID=656366 RepID=A0A1H5HRP8_9MICC|nr:hypothetical protein SAMN04489740_1088 [Arthrobacter alpinus]
MPHWPVERTCTVSQAVWWHWLALAIMQKGTDSAMSLMGVWNLAELDPGHVRLRKRSLRLARRSGP